MSKRSRPPGEPEGLVESPEILFDVFERAPDAMLLVDANGRILKANAETERIFGYERGAIMGREVELLIPDRLEGIHRTHRRSYMEAPRSRPMGGGLELIGKRHDGSEVPLDIMLSPIRVSGNPVILAVVRDATERKRLEAEAAREWELSIREIHHRVKNNLQVVSSLLYLQGIRVHDQRLAGVLEECRARVGAIAMIHERLYRTAGLDSLDFGDYAADLAASLRALHVGSGIAVEIEAGGVRLEMERAVPCALITNELISNALKHAFPDGRTGTVRVAATQSPSGALTLTVEDDGVGLPPGFQSSRNGSFGLQLVTDYVRQLDGTVTHEGESGTRWRIEIPDVPARTRR